MVRSEEKHSCFTENKIDLQKDLRLAIPEVFYNRKGGCRTFWSDAKIMKKLLAVLSDLIIGRISEEKVMGN